jgi:hypothetical protein
MQAEPLAEQVMRQIDHAAMLYHQLILLVASSGTGKTKVLQEVAQRTGCSCIKVNLELSRGLLDFTERQRALQVSRVLSDIVGKNDERHCHLKAKVEEQAAFIARLEAWVVEWSEEWELLFVDEATVRRHPTLTAQGSVGGEVPEGPTGDDHTTGHIDGAAAPLPGRTHDHISPELGQGECAPFLEHLLACHPGTQLLVSHDRGAQHQGAPVEAVIREANGRLGLQAQPADSPDLHPQECIGNWWRRGVTHNHWLATFQEQIEAVRNFFRYLAGVKDRVRRLCGLKNPESFVASIAYFFPDEQRIAGPRLGVRS